MRLLALGLLLPPLAWATQANLNDVYLAAQSANPSLAAAAAAVDAAEQNLIGANATLNPSINLRATAGASETLNSNIVSSEGGAASLSGAITATLPLIAPAESAGIDAKRAAVATAQVSASAATQQLTLDVAGAYFDALTAQAELEAADAQVSAVARQLERAEQRLDVGLGTRVDVDRAQASYDLAAVGAIRATDTLAQAFDSLEQLTGERYDALADFSDRYQAVEPTAALNQVLQNALAQSPAMRTAQAGVDSARAGVDSALASDAYRVDAEANTGASKNLRGGVWASDYGVKLTLSVPLYSGGRNQASQASAVAGLTQAQANLEVTRREIVRTTRSLYRSIATQAQTVTARRQAIRSAQTAVEATEGAYEVGSGDIIDVLNAQSDLFSAQSDYQIARYQHARLSLQLEQLQGDLSGDDLAAINQMLAP